jgi:CubicO group peptidase (beta-lactamase class C family)
VPSGGSASADSIGLPSANESTALTPLDARALRQHIDRIFTAVTPPAAPGCVVGVQRGGEVLLRGAYGLASLEQAVPLSPHSRFRIASVSKQFTVTAVLTCWRPRVGCGWTTRFMSMCPSWRRCRRR